MKQRDLSTDVLVPIGGGMAGCFAAIKAREQGRDVVLVDKGFVSKSGETPYAGDTVVFNEAWGHDLDAWLTQVSVVGEYLNDRRWNEIVFPRVLSTSRVPALGSPVPRGARRTGAPRASLDADRAPRPGQVPAAGQPGRSLAAGVPDRESQAGGPLWRQDRRPLRGDGVVATGRLRHRRRRLRRRRRRAPGHPRQGVGHVRRRRRLQARRLPHARAHRRRPRDGVSGRRHDHRQGVPEPSPHEFPRDARLASHVPLLLGRPLGRTAGDVA